MAPIKYRKMPGIYSKMPNAETCPIIFSIMPDKIQKLISLIVLRFFVGTSICRLPVIHSHFLKNIRVAVSVPLLLIVTH